MTKEAQEKRGNKTPKPPRIVECSVDLVGVAPLGFGRPKNSVKEEGENHDVFEERTWRERLHVDSQGEVFFPGQALKNALSEVAKYLGETIPGKGKATYTKHFEAGIIVPKPLMLGVAEDQVESERLFVPSDGRRGGGSRVWKKFPVLPQWKTTATILLIDMVLTGAPDKVRSYLEHAGQFIGIGRFRPRNNGYYGRFKIENFTSKIIA